MLRARFQADGADWRPVKFPPPGPAWCTGYAADESYSVVVAYVENEGQVREFWLEASNVDVQDADSIIFTDRFERPDWWPEGQLTLKKD